MNSSPRSGLATTIFAALLFTFPVRVFAQTTAAAIRVTQPIDETSLVRLQGNTHPLPRPEFDRDAVSPNFPMLTECCCFFWRTKEQEAALESLLNDQQDKLSPRYHRWLTPAQFGQQFGPADQDLQSITLLACLARLSSDSRGTGPKCHRIFRHCCAGHGGVSYRNSRIRG